MQELKYLLLHVVGEMSWHESEASAFCRKNIASSALWWSIIGGTLAAQRLAGMKRLSPEVGLAAHSAWET